MYMLQSVSSSVYVTRLITHSLSRMSLTRIFTPPTTRYHNYYRALALIGAVLPRGGYSIDQGGNNYSEAECETRFDQQHGVYVCLCQHANERPTLADGQCHYSSTPGGIMFLMLVSAFWGSLVIQYIVHCTTAVSPRRRRLSLSSLLSRQTHPSFLTLRGRSPLFICVLINGSCSSDPVYSALSSIRVLIHFSCSALFLCLSI